MIYDRTPSVEAKALETLRKETEEWRKRRRKTYA